MPLTPGTRLGPYQILDAVGSGAMGDVYRAKDTRLDRVVAIKAELPAEGIPLDSDWPGPPGTRVIEWGNVAMGPDPFTYAWVKADRHRNLFCLPLH